MNKVNLTPILSPLLALLRSRKFVTAVTGVIVSTVIALVPQLQGAENELIMAVTAVVIAVIGGTAIEDAAKAKSTE